MDQGDFWGWQNEYDGWHASFMDQGDLFDPLAPYCRFKRGLWKAAWYGIRKANLGLAEYGPDDGCHPGGEEYHQGSVALLPWMASFPADAVFRRSAHILIIP